MPPPDLAVIIRNARLFDPFRSIDAPGAVMVRKGRIIDIGSDFVPVGDVRVIDAEGMHLLPAFCDPHVHFRTPGQTEKEDIETGSSAALAGGFTTVIQMPNTTPVIDQPGLVEEVTRDMPIELRVLAAVTFGCQSRELTEFDSLLEAGAVGFTDDGQPISVPVFMKAALEFGKAHGVPVASHAEEPSAGLRGAIRSGMIADALGVPGWNPRKETAMVERDIALARETGGHVHFCHVSTWQSVEAIRAARKEGLKVTAEVTPHHFTLLVDDVPDLGTDGKMNPPLGTGEDREALIGALADGTIDCIATDHAPHTPEEKMKSLEKAPFGVIGLETSFAVAHTELVVKGRMTLERLIDAMSRIPREIYHLEEIGLAKGLRADLVMVDLEKKWMVDPERFESKARNCPFARRELTGQVQWTMYAGEILWGEA